MALSFQAGAHVSQPPAPEEDEAGDKPKLRRNRSEGEPDVPARVLRSWDYIHQPSSPSMAGFGRWRPDLHEGPDGIDPPD